jgi:hypothetical protein
MEMHAIQSKTLMGHGNEPVQLGFGNRTLADISVTNPSFDECIGDLASI